MLSVVLFGGGHHHRELRPSPRWPGGHGNFGLAHGIAGPLALLAMALRHGHAVPGQTQAIIRICDWLDRWRTAPARAPGGRT
ncbi:lanthionine synthetase LanC family protein [Streptomyces sp. NPDC002078]